MFARACSAACRWPSPVKVASVMPQFALESAALAGLRGAAAAETAGAGAAARAGAVRETGWVEACGADEAAARGAGKVVAFEAVGDEAGMGAVAAAFEGAASVAARVAGAVAPARRALAGWISEASPPVDHCGARDEVRTLVGGSSMGSSNWSDSASRDADTFEPDDGAGSGPQAVIHSVVRLATAP